MEPIITLRMGSHDFLLKFDKIETATKVMELFYGKEQLFSQEKTYQSV